MFYGSIVPVLYLSLSTLYKQLTAFYKGWPVISHFTWSNQDRLAYAYDRVTTYLLNYDVYLTAACLTGLVLIRYMVPATWKHVVLSSSSSWQRNAKKSTTHGSATLCSQKRLCQLHQKDGIPIGGIVSSSHYQDPEKLTQDIQKKNASSILRLNVDHSLVVAPSGAGKGIGIVIPTLLDYEGSVLVTDIKGENYAVTAELRRIEKKRRVYALDPFKITDGKGSVSFNVLDLLDKAQESLVDDSATLSNLLCPALHQEAGVSQYFANQAAAVIQCLILYVVCSDDIRPEDKHLETVYNLLSKRDEAFKVLLNEISKSDMAYGTPSRLASMILGTEERELSATKKSARVELRFLESPEVRRCVSSSSFRLHGLVSGTSDLYLCIPSEKLDVQSRLVRLVIGATFMVLQKTRGTLSKHKLLMLLDEMPALGFMPQIENALTYGRGYGVTLMAISQTIEKIKAVYPKSWKTFLSSHLSIFFGASDYETCELISNSLGSATVQSRSENQGHSQSKQEVERFGASASNATSQQSGASFSETRRFLLTPDEVRRLDPKVLIAFLRGEDPLMLQRLNYLKNGHYRGRYQNNFLHTRGGD